MGLKIAVTGSTGMVGESVVAHFKKMGHSITRIVHESGREFKEDVIRWNISEGTLDAAALEGHDVIIHLAGANIAGKKWTAAYKKKIYSSRVDGTKLLTETLRKLQQPPKVFLAASAVGYYGNAPATETFSEDSFPADDYLANVCKAWEKEAEPAKAKGIRVVNMRFGTILSTNGGALAKMLPIFQLGLGGRIGSGRQMFSWILLEEIPLIMDFIITRETISGAVNFVAPGAVSNTEFTAALGEVLNRPTVLPLPGFAVKLMFGEMGEALLLGGARVIPKRLEESGYEFRYPSIESALSACLVK